MSFDTGYVGAHRWAVNTERGYHWTCTCGRTGSIATTNVHFVQECFARHAHDALQEAAVALLVGLVPTPSQELIGALRAQGDVDKANLLQLVANQREEPVDLHNEIAQEGLDRCACGCKYWEHDRCVDCGTHVTHPSVDRSIR